MEKLSEVFLLLRPRWEYVDVEKNRLKTANALTTRLQVGASLQKQIRKGWGIGAYGEITAVIPLYNRYFPQREGYETVADEDGYRITQLYATATLHPVGIRVGRQAINIANQRFVGSVNWRQMPQTFDALSLYLNPSPGLKFETHYIVSRQGVLDKLSTDPFEDKPPNHSWVSLLTYGISTPLEIGVYSVNLKENSDTYGGFLKGKIPLGGFTFSYRSEYALQITHTQKVKDRGYYLHLKVGLSRQTPLGVPYLIFGYERLGEHLVTPLATLHKFNGWADLFLTYTATGNDYGLEDLYGTLGLKNHRLGRFEVVLHRFRSVKTLPSDGRDFGSEIDLLWERKIFKDLSLVAKYAKYTADGDAKGSGVGDKDTTKGWLMLVYRFSF